MKKVLAILALLSVGFVLEASWKELIAPAEAVGGVPAGNGDVNGDGTIDISDGGVGYGSSEIFHTYVRAVRTGP